MYVNIFCLSLLLTRARMCTHGNPETLSCSSSLSVSANASDISVSFYSAFLFPPKTNYCLSDFLLVCLFSGLQICGQGQFGPACA